MNSCNLMRHAVITSALMLLSGVLLLLGAEMTALFVPTAQLALLLVLGGACLLAVTFVAAALPAGSRWLSNCQH
ncbi:hypothetical protein [Thiorhodococcus minor]|uniref:Uncharacterized protein n=1 Tax=Thiorhodococcus minor TaxID=57489 RepID=A0A6M0K1T8_9GAMM|nr:hypothetical protein [Thiorhodococcus minor]NEV63291.1 hypothetical protein [Thiorhodococcus minor]